MTRGLFIYKLTNEPQTTNEMERDLWVKEQVFPLYDNGKDLEVRARTRWLEGIQIKDTLNIHSGSGKTIRREVLAIRLYDDFPALLLVEDPARIVPGYDKERVLAALRKIYRSRPEKKGVIVFELKTIPP